MKPILLGLPCLLSMATVHGHPAPPAQQPDPFTVKASVSQSPLYRANVRFDVDVTIRNRSAVDQVITVWTQFGWSWISDNPAVEPDISAIQNVPTKIILKPQQAFSGSFEVVSTQPRGPITFRLGFVPNASKPESTAAAPPLNVTWSNTVTVTER